MNDTCQLHSQNNAQNEIEHNDTQQSYVYPDRSTGISWTDAFDLKLKLKRELTQVNSAYFRERCMNCRHRTTYGCRNWTNSASSLTH